jgi:hypothetical protein
MPYLSDSLPASTSPAGLRHPTLADVADSLAETLGAALAHASGTRQLESRRQMERVLGRELEPLFAQELLTLLLAQGSEGRGLRAAFIKLISMTESREWLESLAPGPFTATGPGDEAGFLASEAAAGARELARCTECLARAAAECAGECLSGEAAASRQWARCAECRCGIGADFTPDSSAGEGR